MQSSLYLRQFVYCGLTLFGTLANAQTTQPATRPADEIMASVQATATTLNTLLADPKTLTDPTKRDRVAPQAIVLLKQLDADMHELATERPQMAAQAQGIHFQTLEHRTLLGDTDAREELATMASSADPITSMRGKAALLMVDWTQADRDPAAQAKLVDQVEVLGHQHPDSTTLTAAASRMADTAAAPPLRDRLNTLISDVMHNPVATRIQSMRAMKEANKTLESLTGQVYTLTGVTVDGKPFTTAAWKGKVVLVDFWATWCGPCKAALPGVKKAYLDWHDKGLEIVGVSNDYSADALKVFTTDSKMPWPQLFDPAAASRQEWNPITTSAGIDAIPHMLLIGRDGKLLSADAGENLTDLIAAAIARPS